MSDPYFDIICNWCSTEARGSGPQLITFIHRHDAGHHDYQIPE